MAGIIGIGSGHGGRRPVDAELHLVPLIDLLCSLISFLLMTAVWAQISRLELKNGSERPDAQESAAADTNKMLLSVHIHDKGFTVKEDGSGSETRIPCTATQCFRAPPAADSAAAPPRAEFASFYDYPKLKTALAAEKAKFTNQKDVTIVLADSIPYNEMVRTMDTCLLVGLDGISLSGSAH
jgi:biopolymer transport protein TolR